MREVVIVSACRTALGRFLGTLKDVPATKLGAITVKESITRAGISPEQVDQVIMGNVISTGLGQNPARQAQLGAGIPPEKSAFLINMVCGSSLHAATLAMQSIALGEMDVIVAGGMESMSLTPYMVRKAREGFKLGNVKLEDSMVMDGLWCAIDNHHMGETGELVADKYEITREEMDEFAANSHAKAADAMENGRFNDEIVPVEVQMRKETVMFDKDEAVRPGTTAEGLAKLRPVFRKEGRITAANAPGTNDGAAAVMLMSREKADELGLKPIARVLGGAIGGLEPKWVMMTPVPAVNNLLKKLDMKKEDFDLYELNEAFSVQAIAVTRELGLDPSIVNVNGGAVALGHPIGASGARILTTLLYALKDRGLKRGIASMCLGGANGVSFGVEML